MDIPKIERYVEDLLTVSGFSREGAEQHLWVLLHHLYSAVAMFEQLEAEDKIIVAATQKKLKYFFESKISLRTRKRNKKEKEGNPPHPLANEKENNKEKEERKNERAVRDFSDALEMRREAFRQECYTFLGKYDTQQVADFFHYWAEEDKKTGKMLWEMEKSWNTKFRLARWNNNQYTSATTAAAIRLRKTKASVSKEVLVAKEQSKQAAERKQAEAQREQAQEESKQGRMLTDEYIANNPNGFMAKCAREREEREQQQAIKDKKQ